MYIHLLCISIQCVVNNDYVLYSLYGYIQYNLIIKKIKNEFCGLSNCSLKYFDFGLFL